MWRDLDKLLALPIRSPWSRKRKLRKLKNKISCLKAQNRVLRTKTSTLAQKSQMLVRQNKDLWTKITALAAKSPGEAGQSMSMRWGGPAPKWATTPAARLRNRLERPGRSENGSNGRGQMMPQDDSHEHVREPLLSNKYWHLLFDVKRVNNED